MTDKSVPVVEEIASITDPGEINRHEHIWSDRIVINIGNLFAWAFPILIVCIIAQIVFRLSGNNQAWLDDLQWWIYGAAVLAGFCYAITTNSHVRVDIFYDNFSKEKKARTDMFALGWLLLPFIVLMIDIMTHYAVSSWKAWEGSDSPNGLHNLFILKTLLPLLFLLAAVAAMAKIARNMTRTGGWDLFRFTIWTFPGLWFAFQRLAVYAGYWFYRVTQPDLNPRRINREAYFEYTTLIAMACVFALLAYGWFQRRKRAAAQG